MLAQIRLFMCFELLATGGEQLVPQSHVLLPIGGSQLAQMGLILIVIVVQAEVQDYIATARVHRRAKRARRLSNQPND